MKTREGELIHLMWECHDPDFAAVRGHVDIEAFIRKVEGYDPEEYNADIFRQPRHAWAIWLMSGCDSVDEGMSFLSIRDSPGRGRFKVTVADRIPSFDIVAPNVGDKVRQRGSTEVGEVYKIDESESRWGPPTLRYRVRWAGGDSMGGLSARNLRVGEEMPKWGPICSLDS